MSLVRLVVITENLNSADVLWNGSRVTPFTYVTLIIFHPSINISALEKSLTLDSIVEMNLGIICSCMMFIPTFFSKSRGVAYSMKSALLSRTRISLSKTGSAESHTYTNEPKDSIQPREVGLEAWEKQVPDLELLTEDTRVGRR